MSIEHEREPLLRLRCPACSGPSRVRNSQDLSPSTRRLYMQCMNPRCRCIFESIAETTKVFAPSMLPESEQDPQMLTMRKGKRFAEAGKRQVAKSPRARGEGPSTEKKAQYRLIGLVHSRSAQIRND